MRKLGRVRTWAAAAAALATAWSASAQLTPPQNQNRGPGGVPRNVRPPTPGGKSDTPPTLTLIGLTVILGGAIVAAALIPSKRGHQD